MAILETKDLRKIYGSGENEVHALDGVSISVEEGEFVAVIGTSGSGKSTLLNMIGGLDRPTSGSVTIRGKELLKMKDEELTIFRRRNIGFVFQNYNLIDYLTPEENVMLGGKKDIEKILEAVGIPREDWKRQVLQLSGGQQQRTAIGRAIVKNPDILLCDEPTGALDYQTGKAILKLLQDTGRKTGMTVVIITHNGALTAMADRVIHVKNGTVCGIEKNEHPMDISEIEW